MAKKKAKDFAPDDVNKTARRLAVDLVGSDEYVGPLTRAIHKDIASGHWFPTDAETDVILKGDGTGLLSTFPYLNEAIQATRKED